MYKKIGTALRISCFVLLLLLVGCDFNKVTDAADDFRLILGLEEINTTPTVLITDSRTGELMNKKVEITFLGQNGEDVIDIYSDPIASEQVTDGILNFGIRNSINPSDARPVEIQLLLNSDGYIQTSKTIRITKEGTSDFSVKMLKEDLNQLPSGIRKSINKEGAADANGTINTDISIESFARQNEGGHLLRSPPARNF